MIEAFKGWGLPKTTAGGGLMGIVARGAQNQVIESKFYFGNEDYLIFAEERYSNTC